MRSEAAAADIEIFDAKINDTPNLKKEKQIFLCF